MDTNNIDVYKLVEEVEKEHIPQQRERIEEFIDSVEGKTYSAGEVLTEVINPIIGIVSTYDRIFTAKLIQRVLDECSKEQ